MPIWTLTFAWSIDAFMMADDPSNGCDGCISNMQCASAITLSLQWYPYDAQRDWALKPLHQTVSQDQQKQYLSAITSSDIILWNLRGNPGTPGHLQLMFGELLAKQKVSWDFRDMCSALNLAPSQKYTLHARAKTVLNQLLKYIDLGARDLVLLFFDNIRFKVLGRQASYDQWILINIVVIPENDLKTADSIKMMHINKYCERWIMIGKLRISLSMLQ